MDFPPLEHAISLVMHEDQCDASEAARTLRQNAADNDTSLRCLADEIVITVPDAATGREVKALVATRHEVAMLREAVAQLSDAVNAIRES